MTSARMQQRRDTGANWAAANPVLTAGEIGVDTDTGVLKVGDGVTAWSSLRGFLPGPVDYAEAVRTAGDISVNTAGWQNVSTAVDLSLSARSGDLIAYSPSFSVGGTNNALAFDVQTVGPGNTFSGGATNGQTGWYCVGSTTMGVSGTVHYRCQAADIVLGAVTLRLRVNPANTTARAIAANAASPLRVQAINLGQLL